MTEIVECCKRLKIVEMRLYIREEISKFLPDEYKTMTIDEKIKLYKLNSFLYFCNTLDSKEEVLACMQQMCNTKKFKDRNNILKNDK